MLQLESIFDIEKLHTVVRMLSPEIGIPSMESHITRWAFNKNDIYRMFGNKLKIEKPVDSFVSHSLAEKTINSFLQFIEDKMELSLVYNFLKFKLFDGKQDELIQNYLSEPQTYFGVKFNSGMKISRILPRLTTKKYSEWIQIEYSKVVQSFSIKGTAVLSIDPIDYITMSENASGWRSCHSLDGEYRVGTLAYMMDTCSVVAYVTTKDIDFRTVKVADKMWRQMVLIKCDGKNSYAVQSRQYPSTNPSNAGTISTMLTELFKEYTDNEYHFQKENVGNLQRVVQDVDCGSLWYNDIVRGSFKSGRIVLPKAYSTLADFLEYGIWREFRVGVSTVRCVCGCGADLEEADYIYYESRYSDDYDYEEESYEEEEE